MRFPLCFALLATTGFGLALPGSSLNAKEAAPPPAAEKKRSPEDIESATRLQVFLDRANFPPGKIDGRYGDYTNKAIAFYRQAHDIPAPKNAPPPAADKKDKGKEKEKSKDKKAPSEPAAAPAPDTTGLDLASVNPVFTSYKVTEADLQNVGPMPDSVVAQSKQKSLPYADAAEAIAEKFHADKKFLLELNPGSTAIKAGDTLKVPNVEPFDLAAVKDFKPTPEPPAEESKAKGKDKDKGKSKDKEKDKSDTAAAPTTAVKVSLKDNTLTVYENGKLVSAYPITVGSQQTESPVGEWKVKGFDKMPTFRYDKSMLNKGERSSDFHMLPPGPNNPVGVMWIALNRKGIGLHGTAEPDSIGRSASHGCVRLANWDIMRLAPQVRFGVPVTIH